MPEDMTPRPVFAGDAEPDGGTGDPAETVGEAGAHADGGPGESTEAGVEAAAGTDGGQDHAEEPHQVGMGETGDDRHETAIPSTGIPQRDQPRPRHTSEELELVHRHAMLAAAAASSLKGEDIRILEVHELVSYTDFLVVCSGRSVRQTRRIAEEVEGRIKKELGLNPSHVAGRPAGPSAEGGEWILIDYLDFVVHVFTPEAREFYRLDTLWKEAPVEVIE